MQVRTAIMDGWVGLIGADNVAATSLTGAVATIEGFKPTIVMGIGSYLPESTYFGEIAGAARRGGAVPVFWATEDPYEQDAAYRITHDFDVLFSCDRWGVNFHEHPCAVHLPLAGCGIQHYVAFDPDAPRPVDVMFCGVAFTSRKELVSDLLPALSGLQLRFIGPGWGEFGAGFSDRRIDKSELISLYAGSKIVLNLGRSLHFENRRHMIAPSSPGPRTFEAALAGVVQLFHEDTFEIRRYFTPHEMPTFSNPKEFQALLSAYLNDASARASSAVAAQTRALADHTYTNRARRVVDVLGAQGLL